MKDFDKNMAQAGWIQVGTGAWMPPYTDTAALARARQACISAKEGAPTQAAPTLTAPTSPAPQSSLSTLLDEEMEGEKGWTRVADGHWVFN